ncbi:MAG: NUDIX hydrolase [Clostridia bacterium]|nr:NUDIX hydrolase [Clostridia bacterium]
MEQFEWLRNYIPQNEQEEKDKQVMLNFTEKFDNLFTRENDIAHFTASAWVVNPERTKVLMIYHNIYQSWAWTGGHADGETDLLKVAVKELKEETGVEKVTVISEEPFSIEVLCVNGHEKRGKYVSSHLHFNVTFLLEVTEEEMLRCKPDENSGVKWCCLKDVEKLSSEPWMNERIYRKLNGRLNM